MLKRIGSKYGLIALSILMALLLWFYVVNQENAGNPQNRALAELNYVNAAADYTVDGPDTVSVSLWGTAGNSGPIQAYVDLAGLSEGEHVLKVHVQPVPGALFTAVDPNEVTVTLIGVEEKELRITRELIGSTTTGTELGEVVLSSDKCIVRGDSAALAEVAVVAAPIIIEGLSGVLNQEVALQARDAEGTVLTDVTLLPAQVQVMGVAERHLESRLVAVEAVSSGELPEGYELVSITLAAEEVTVIGYGDNLLAIERLQTEELVLAEQTESFTVYLNLVTPAGVSASPARLLAMVEIAATEAEPVFAEGEPEPTEGTEPPAADDNDGEDGATTDEGDGDEADTP